MGGPEGMELAFARDASNPVHRAVSAVGARIRVPCEAEGSEPMTTPIRVQVVDGGLPPDGQLLKNAIDWGTGAEG